MEELVIDDLPNEILVEIFLKVDSVTRTRAERVCKRWNAVLKETPVLRSIVKLDLSILPWGFPTPDRPGKLAVPVDRSCGKYFKHGHERSSVKCLFITDESNPDKPWLTKTKTSRRFPSGAWIEMCHRVVKYGMLTDPIKVILDRTTITFQDFAQCKVLFLPNPTLPGVTPDNRTLQPMDFVSGFIFFDVEICEIPYVDRDTGKNYHRSLWMDDVAVFPRSNVWIDQQILNVAENTFGSGEYQN